MNGLKNRGKSPSIPSSARCICRGNLSLPVSLFCFEFFWRSLFPFIPYTDGWGPVTHCGSWAFFVFRYSNDECSKEDPVKKIFRNFSGGLIFALSRDLPLEGQNLSPVPWQSNTHSTGTFLIGGEGPSRMKVRHELPAHKGYHGKQGW